MAADALFIIPTDVYVRGNLKMDSILVPDASFGDGAFDVASPLSALKQAHQYLVRYNRVTPVTENVTVHQAYAAGTLVQVQATCTTAGVGAANVTVQVRKNGVSVMSGAFTVGSGLAAFGVVVGTLNAALTGYSANDVFDLVLTATATSGTLPQGLLVTLLFREAAGS